ncbi:MAG TPA: uroporphyrinogen decarboxylase [Deltaproteobacteria bacterium]|nr:uroporphyrinogen decarboxylase [Deltaproteobacteria bacterium]
MHIPDRLMAQINNTKKNDLLLRVFRGEQVSRVPVWMMRQAGRTDPEYIALRETDGRPLEELFGDVTQSIRVSLLPKRLGIDAIIMFQDILTPLAPMGAPFVFRPGPISKPIQTLEQVYQLRLPDPEADLSHVGAILQGIHEELQDELPVLGFAGAPVTLAFFLLAGGSPHRQQKKILEIFENHPKLVELLLEKLTQMTIDYLNYQLTKGAQAVQLFESFADELNPELYERWALPTQQQVFAGLNKGTNSLLFAKECPYLDWMAQSGAKGLSVGSCIDLRKAQELYPDLIWQGNVSNQLLRDGSLTEITQATQDCLAATGGHSHILNLSHGLLADTPFTKVQHFVDTAHALQN